MCRARTILTKIEQALASRIPSALTPIARTIRPVRPTGVAELDELLRGGIPVGALMELVGAECTGRTSVALSFLAGLTQANSVCAWIDSTNSFDPASAAACGVDSERLIWVRCGVSHSENLSGVRTAGCMIARQRPGTAKGFIFLSMEDETGIANVIVTPDLFERERLIVTRSKFILAEGPLQNTDGVIHVKAMQLRALSDLSLEVKSHDFH